MQFSYWEQQSFLSGYDIAIIGAGIVGLSAGLYLKQNNPSLKILILERGFMPSGASTKNAGFACFGSAGELLDDLKTMKEDIVWETVEMRYKGLMLLRNRLGDKALDFKSLGEKEKKNKERIQLLSIMVIIVIRFFLG